MSYNNMSLVYILNIILSTTLQTTMTNFVFNLLQL